MVSYALAVRKIPKGLFDSVHFVLNRCECIHCNINQDAHELAQNSVNLFLKCLPSLSVRFYQHQDIC